MKCPVDNATLQMTTREGIEIDYCPECRGVWLDRGELDKLIERSAGAPQGFAPQQGQGQIQYDQRPQDNSYGKGQYRRDDDDDDYRRHDGHHKKHKKEGFLGDLFDF